MWTMVVIPSPASMAFGTGLDNTFGKPLTKREIEIIELKCGGLTNKEVGHALSITEQTVKNHISTAMSRTNAPNIVALCVRYTQWKMGKGDVFVPPQTFTERMERLEAVVEAIALHRPDRTPESAPS